MDQAVSAPSGGSPEYRGKPCGSASGTGDAAPWKGESCALVGRADGSSRSPWCWPRLSSPAYSPLPCTWVTAFRTRNVLAVRYPGLPESTRYETRRGCTPSVRSWRVRPTQRFPFRSCRPAGRMAKRRPTTPAAFRSCPRPPFCLDDFELQQALIVSPVHRRSWVTDLGPGQYLVEVILERSAGSSTNE